MAFLTPWWAVLVLTTLVAVAIAARWLAPRRDPDPAPDSLPAAHLTRVRLLPRYQQLARRSLRSLWCSLAAWAVIGLGCVWLVAQPLETGPDESATSNRDLVLCLDVSGSMVETNRHVIDAYLELASRLEGERIGLVLFDATAVTVFPLTDDAAFITEHLERVSELLGADVPGTKIGGAGTSLIGDGLTSCLHRFDAPDEDRSRTVVIATDNQVFGRPLFSLEEAGRKAADASVMVYGVVPGDNLPDATRELTDVARSTGGDVWLLTPERSRDVGGIEAAVRSQEQALLDQRTGETARVQHLPGVVLCALGGVMVLIPRTPLRRGSAVGLLAVLPLLALVVLHAGPDEEQTENPADPAEFLLVIDRTTSMGALDFDGGQPRMAGVEGDVRSLVAARPDARYAVVVFDNEPHLVLPWTTDSRAVVTLVETLGWRESSLGSGSDIRAALGLAQEVFEGSVNAASAPDRHLVYFGDGEETSPGQTTSVGALGRLVTDALVLGYGTVEGAPMRTSPYSEDFVMFKGEVAISVMDGDSLEVLADELGGSFMHRQSNSALEFWPAPAASDPPAPSLPPAVNIVWLSTLAMAVVVAWQLWRGSTHIRLARREVLT